MPGGVWEMPDKKQNNVDIVSDECEQTIAFGKDGVMLKKVKETKIDTL